MFHGKGASRGARLFHIDLYDGGARVVTAPNLAWTMAFTPEDS